MNIGLAAEVLEERTMLSGAAVEVPSKPEILSPTGNTSNPSVTVEWTAASGDVESYQLLVYNFITGRPVIAEFDIEVTSFEINLFPLGQSFQMFVRAVNSEGVAGEYSDANYLHFVSVNSLYIPADIPAITGPRFEVADTRPTISWTASRVNKFDLILYNATDGVLIHEANDIRNTDYTLPIDLKPFYTYQAFVRSHDSNDSDGVFSEGYTFTTVGNPATSEFSAPIVTGPAKVVGVSQPTIVWNASKLLALEFNVLVYNMRTGQEVVNVRGVSGTKFALTNELNVGDTHQVFVQARFIDGTFSDFSDSYEFFVQSRTLVPRVHSLHSAFPEAAISTPTFRWFTTSRTLRFELIVYNVETGQEVHRNSAITNTVYTLPAPLTESGRYQVFVRGFNTIGEAGFFSDPVEFDVVIENDEMDDLLDTDL